MFLGRIITRQKNLDVLDFVDVTDKPVEGDSTTPTIVVGKSLAESVYGRENVHIIDRRIADNVYWTYSKTEKRSEFEAGMARFESHILKSLRRSVRYGFFSIFRSTYTERKQVVRALCHGKTGRAVYVTGNSLYIYSGGDSVMGISLDELSYVGINRDKVVGRLRSNRNNRLLFSDAFLSYRMKDWSDRDPVITVYLYYAKSGLFSQ